jgi:hypothetical protein
MLAQCLEDRHSAKDSGEHRIGERLSGFLQEGAYRRGIRPVLKRRLDATPLLDGNDDKSRFAALGYDLSTHW